MIKRIMMLAHLLLAAFLVKFLDADSDSGGSDSDSGGSDSDSGGSDSDSGGSSDGLSSSLETMEWSDSDSYSGDSSGPSSQRKKPVPGAQDLLSNLSQEDLSQIPHRNDFPGPQ